MSASAIIATLVLLSFALCSFALPPSPPTDADCLLASPKAPNPFQGQCGQYNASRAPTSRGRIVGGDDAYRGQFPWQAYSPNPGCGAIVIDEWHVVTAAHCIEGIDDMIGLPVVVGHVYLKTGKDALNFSRSETHECTAQVRKIKHVQAHPCYCDYYERSCGRASSPFPGNLFESLQNDIAVITLDASLTFNEFVQPICLPQQNEEFHNETMAIVSGFGDSKGPPPENLLYVAKPVVSNKECASLIPPIFGIVTDDMLCAGYLEGGKILAKGIQGVRS